MPQAETAQPTAQGSPRQDPAASDIEGMDAPADRRTKLLVKGDEALFRIPAAGLGVWDELRLGAVGALGLAALYAALGTPMGGPGALRLVLVGSGLGLIVAAAFGVMKGLLGRTEVLLREGGLIVSTTFPVPRSQKVHRTEFRGITLGRPELIEGGYNCRDWEAEELQLIIRAAGRLIPFGGGLSPAEQRWLKKAIETRLKPVKGDRTRAPAAEQTQPPERFWRKIATSSAYALVGGLILLLACAAVGAGAAVMVSVFVLVLVCATAAFLSFRSYRLERAAGGWHRAVVRYQASLRDLNFSEEDVAEIGRWLPDFEFFRGPRRLYNVAWSETDPYRITLFDFTCGDCKLGGDGVGCAVRVKGLGSGYMSFRPHPFAPLTNWVGGMEFPDYPDVARRYRVKAENEGRTRHLVRNQVIEALMDWNGPGPAPWVCIRDGMVGLSIQRKYAERQDAMGELCTYAERLAKALAERLQDMRN